MPHKWMGGIHKGQVGKRWSWREKTHRCDAMDKSCNSGRQEYEMGLHTKFSTEPAKEEWPSSLSRVRLPP